MKLDSYIESILFFKGTPVSVSYLSKVLGKADGEILEAIGELEAKLEGRGLVLTRLEDKISIGTAPKASGFIEALIKEDFSKDIGRAGLETLSIIIYRGPISRSEIDYIRGVNSSFILRNLLIRDLIEKDRNSKDQRVSMYKPTFKLLSFLGIKNIEDMPKYKEVKNNIKAFEDNKIDESIEDE